MPNESESRRVALGFKFPSPIVIVLNLDNKIQCTVGSGALELLAWNLFKMDPK